MPFLILPPTFMITENPEVSLAVKNSALTYQNNLLNQLGVTNAQEQVNISKGGYRGTRIFSWNKTFDAYLSTYFLFPVGKSQVKEFFHSASLVRYQDCLQLGGVWNVINHIEPFPIQDSKLSIENIANRRFSDKSPVKVNSFYDFQAEDRISNLLDIFLGEKLASEGVLNVTNLSRIVCKGNYLPNLKSQTNLEFPARPHLLIIVELISEFAQKKKSWPDVTYRVSLNSGVFGEKNKEFFYDKTPTPFQPEKISEKIFSKIMPELHDLKTMEFKVIRRYRGWVYLDRGRAFGLEIGTRLIGPSNSKLHVIRYIPEVKGEIDSSVAFIRYEDEKRPIVVGDILKIDPTLFPQAKSSDIKNNK